MPYKRIEDRANSQKRYRRRQSEMLRLLKHGYPELFEKLKISAKATELRRKLGYVKK